VVAGGREEEMTTVVVDASVIVKLLVDEPNSSNAASLVESHHLVTPDFARLEVGNTLWSRVHAGHFDGATAQRFLVLLDEIKIDTIASAPLVGRALAWATEIDHPIYDCVYLALAERVRCALVTADNRFMSAIRRAGHSDPSVHSLADFP
jgi:predicted nucleic acid-binding protein